jgi:hypothetical protein
MDHREGFHGISNIDGIPIKKYLLEGFNPSDVTLTPKTKFSYPYSPKRDFLSPRVLIEFSANIVKLNSEEIPTNSRH